MKKILASLFLAGLAAAPMAGVTQSFGSGSAVKYLQYAADFELNTSLSNDYLEGGLLFRYVGSGNNAGCGYAGVDCVDPGGSYSAAFAGNYLATSGSNAYLSIKATDRDLTALEFAADTGFDTRVYGYWQTWRDGVLTGSGNFDLGAAGVGGVIGLGDVAGFDEVRYFTFSSGGKSTGFSAPALDSVRAFAVPEPGSGALLAVGLLGLAGVRRRGASRKA
jgi:hypothetical protein